MTDIYSKRLKRAQGDGFDVLEYEYIPQELRVQIVHLWSELTGISINDIWRYKSEQKAGRRVFQGVALTLAKEYGRLKLVKEHRYFEYHLHCYSFILNCSTEHALDIVELFFQVLARQSTTSTWHTRVTGAIDELNHRFLGHGVGYQFIDGFIIKVDSQLVHSEVVKPALQLLHESGFEGASEEFMTAYEHYRHGRNKEAITEALKSYESTLKTICDQQGWEYRDSANVSSLVTTVVDNGLVPGYLLNHMNGLRSALDSGIVTLRNKSAAHGQGSQAISVPNSVAVFALHLAAANIVFLVERHKELLKR